MLLNFAAKVVAEESRRAEKRSRSERGCISGNLLESGGSGVKEENKMEAKTQLHTEKESTASNHKRCSETVSR